MVTAHDHPFIQKAEKAAQTAARLRANWTARDLDSAVQLLRESGRLFHAGHASSRAADAYLQAGDIEFTVNAYDKALGLYRTGLHLAGEDPEWRCRALSRIARTYSGQSKLALAQESSKEAVDLSAGLAPEIQAEALEARGESLGGGLEGIEALNQARELFIQAHDHDGEAEVLRLLAYAHLFDDQSLSTALAAQALEIWSAGGNQAGIARVHMLLGFIASVAGEFETARCNCNRGLNIFQRLNDKVFEASVWNTLARVNREAGDPQAALKAYRHAKDIFFVIHDALGETEAITEMGTTLILLHQYQELPSLYARKLLLVRLTGNQAQLASALADKASAYELVHEYGKAEEFYSQALEIYQKGDHPYGESETLFNLGRLHAVQGRYAEALALFESARKGKEKHAQIEDLGRLQYELAGVYRKMNRLEEARSAIEEAVKIIESQRSSIAKFDERASYFAAVHRYYAFYVDLLMLLHQRNPTLQLDAKAFETAEKSKVRSLVDWLTKPSHGAPCDELLKRQIQATLPAPPEPGHLQETEPPPVISLQQAQKEVLGDDDLLIEYSFGDETSHAWAVTTSRILSFDLPEAKRIETLSSTLQQAIMARQLEIKETAIQYVERIRRADRDYRRYAGQLSRLLLGSISVTSVRRIIIVPDGPLHKIPFASLLVADARGRETLLIDDHELVILPSASALAALRRATAGTRPPFAAAVFADPIFERDDPRLSHSASSEPARNQQTQKTGLAGQQPSYSRKIATRAMGGGFCGTGAYTRRLPEAHREAVAVRDYIQRNGETGFIAEGDQASLKTIHSLDLSAYRILHVATHALLNQNNPAIVFSLIDKQGNAQDGCLGLNDIYRMKLSTELVVLSSCESGLGKNLSSEGIFGLPRAFLRAGAKSVIASLWKVDDAATATLMERFYFHLGQGEKPSSALKNSQHEMSRNRYFSNPYYWAGFVLQGEYR